MRCRDLDKIQVHRFPIKAPVEPKNLRIVAWDTETCRDGYARLVTWYDGTEAQSKYITRGDDFFTLLNKMQNYDRCVNYWYNISFDFQALMKWLLELYPSALEQIASYDGSVIRYGKEKYRVKWIPNKFFMIRHGGRHIIRHFDLFQFYFLQHLQFWLIII